MISSEDVKARLMEHITLMSFDYKGVRCGIDPYDDNNFSVFCDGEEKTVHSIEEVMTGKYFKGHPLEEIIKEIDFDEW